MDYICLASTCKGTRCTRLKTSENYCKIHTTNEICSLCNSTQISTTDSILKRSGKSWCIDCRTIKGNETIAKLEEFLENQRIESEKKRLEDKKKLIDLLDQMKERKELLEDTVPFEVYEDIINKIFNTA